MTNDSDNDTMATSLSTCKKKLHLALSYLLGTFPYASRGLLVQFQALQAQL